MSLDKPPPHITISCFEVKPANFAKELPMFVKKL